jgi:hypothetical protein
MSLPGRHLRAFAGRWCDELTMAQLVDPVIADLQYEWIQARDRQRMLAQWRARVLGVAVFWKAIAWHACFGRHRSADSLRRGATSTLLTAVAALVVASTAALDGLALFNLHRKLGELPSLWLTLELVPRILPLSLPVSLVGALFLRRAWPAVRTPRLLLVIGAGASACSFVLLGWIGPLVSQLSRATGSGAAIASPIAEMTVNELARYVGSGGPAGVDPLILLSFYLRFSLAVIPFGIALFVVAIGRCCRGRRSWTMLSGVVGLLIYGVAIVGGAWLAISHSLPAGIAAWSPHLVFVTLAMAVGLSSPSRPSMTSKARSA